MAGKSTKLQDLHVELSACVKCPNMIGPVIIGNPVYSRVIQIGQAPGIHEGRIGKPFGWTAGKALFKWYQGIGVSEETFRDKVYMAAVCRCFPGKHPKHGDRVPDSTEIDQCRPWLLNEIALLKPELIIPVGKLAIAEIMPVNKLSEVIGQQHRLTAYGIAVDIIPLPHPSGASTWPRMEPGKTLLAQALQLIRQHPAWRGSFA